MALTKGERIGLSGDLIASEQYLKQQREASAANQPPARNMQKPPSLSGVVSGGLNATGQIAKAALNQFGGQSSSTAPALKDITNPAQEAYINQGGLRGLGNRYLADAQNITQSLGDSIGKASNKAVDLGGRAIYGNKDWEESFSKTPPKALEPNAAPTAIAPAAKKAAPITQQPTSNKPVITELGSGKQQVTPSEAQQVEWLKQNKDPKHLAEMQVRDDYNKQLIAKNQLLGGDVPQQTGQPQQPALQAQPTQLLQGGLTPDQRKELDFNAEMLRQKNEQMANIASNGLLSDDLKKEMIQSLGNQQGSNTVNNGLVQQELAQKDSQFNKSLALQKEGMSAPKLNTDIAYREMPFIGLDGNPVLDSEGNPMMKRVPFVVDKSQIGEVGGDSQPEQGKTARRKAALQAIINGETTIMPNGNTVTPQDISDAIKAYKVL